MKLIAEIMGSRVGGYSPPNLFVDPSFTLLFFYHILEMFSVHMFLFSIISK